MSSSNEVSSNVEATENVYTESAAARLQQLRAMRDTIPNFVIPKDAKSIQRMSSAASVSPEFVHLGAVVAQKAEGLGIGGPKAERMRDRLAFADAFGPVADEFEAMGHFLRHSIKAAQNEAGSDALIVYNVAKRLAKRPEMSELLPHLADMSRALGARARQARGRAAAAKRKAEVEKAAAGHTTVPPVTAPKP